MAAYGEFIIGTSKCKATTWVSSILTSTILHHKGTYLSHDTDNPFVHQVAVHL